MQDEERLAAEIGRAETKRATLAGHHYDEQIKEFNVSIQAQKAELAKAKRERDGLSSMAGVAGQTQLLERDATQKSESVKTEYAKCLPQLQKLFGDQARPRACLHALHLGG